MRNSSLSMDEGIMYIILNKKEKNFAVEYKHEMNGQCPLIFTKVKKKERCEGALSVLVE